MKRNDFRKYLAYVKEQRHTTIEQENGLISKTPLKTLVSTGNNRGEEVCSRRDSNPCSQLERLE